MSSSASRFAYSMQDDRLMWSFLYERLKVGAECALKPKGRKLWEEFVASGLTEKTVDSLTTHFRRQLFNKPETAGISVEKLLFIVSKLELILTGSQRQEIEHRFNVDIRQNEHGIVVGYTSKGVYRSFEDDTNNSVHLSDPGSDGKKSSVDPASVSEEQGKAKAERERGIPASSLAPLCESDALPTSYTVTGSKEVTASGVPSKPVRCSAVERNSSVTSCDSHGTIADKSLKELLDIFKQDTPSLSASLEWCQDETFFANMQKSPPENRTPNQAVEDVRKGARLSSTKGKSKHTSHLIDAECADGESELLLEKEELVENVAIEVSEEGQLGKETTDADHDIPDDCCSLSNSTLGPTPPPQQLTANVTGDVNKIHRQETVRQESQDLFAAHPFVPSNSALAKFGAHADDVRLRVRAETAKEGPSKEGEEQTVEERMIAVVDEMLPSGVERFAALAIIKWISEESARRGMRIEEIIDIILAENAVPVAAGGICSR